MIDTYTTEFEAFDTLRLRIERKMTSTAVWVPCSNDRNGELVKTIRMAVLDRLAEILADYAETPGSAILAVRGALETIGLDVHEIEADLFPEEME